jgi:hypothetical protein
MNEQQAVHLGTSMFSEMHRIAKVILQTITPEAHRKSQEMTILHSMSTLCQQFVESLSQQVRPDPRRYTPMDPQLMLARQHLAITTAELAHTRRQLAAASRTLDEIQRDLQRMMVAPLDEVQRDLQQAMAATMGIPPIYVPTEQEQEQEEPLQVWGIPPPHWEDEPPEPEDDFNRELNLGPN